MFYFTRTQMQRLCLFRVCHTWPALYCIPIALFLYSDAFANERPWQAIGSLTNMHRGSDTGGWYQTRKGSGTPDTVRDASAANLNSTATVLTRKSVETGVSDTLLLDQQSVRTATDNKASNALKINLDLFVGEVKVLGEVDVKRVAIGNGNIVRAEVLDSGELLVIAAAAGSSSVRLWHTDGNQTDYNIRVSPTDLETRVQMQRMVRMRVRMVEFRKSALGKLGIDWADGTNGPVIAAAGDTASNGSFRPQLPALDALSEPVSAFSTYFGVASNISSRINFLAQNGDAVTLAEPVLSAMNGGEASFLAGGEIPYPSIGQDGRTQVEFKEYGVKLDVAPLIDSAGNIRARLETEISQLDASVSVQGAPGLLTRRAQTQVTVRSGETIVISGLLSSESGTDVDMVPGLGKLPVIGRFFRSTSERNAINELVIFVTPEVIEPGQPMINAREQLYLFESEKRVDTLRQQLPLME